MKTYIVVVIEETKDMSQLSLYELMGSLGTHEKESTCVEVSRWSKHFKQNPISQTSFPKVLMTVKRKAQDKENYVKVREGRS